MKDDESPVISAQAKLPKNIYKFGKSMTTIPEPESPLKTPCV